MNQSLTKLEFIKIIKNIRFCLVDSSINYLVSEDELSNDYLVHLLTFLSSIFCSCCCFFYFTQNK